MSLYKNWKRSGLTAGEYYRDVILGGKEIKPKSGVLGILAELKLKTERKHAVRRRPRQYR